MIKNVGKYLKPIWRGFKNLIWAFLNHDPMIITPYLSYANEHKVYIKGRILEDEGFVLAEESTVFDNLINNLKSFKSDEAKNTKVIITYKDQVIDSYTDNDGYFEVEFNVNQPSTQGEFLEWDTAMVVAPDFMNEKDEVLEAKVNILLPHQHTENIIVSDIDDTVLITHVNSFLKLKMIFHTLFHNERSRLPFEDIADVLHDLTLNQDGKAVNPIFYLSNSPWNLYNLLTNFLKFQNIPLGPLFLRDFGIKLGKKRETFKNHKKNTLEHLLNFYTDHKFILLGDATENDTDIYLDVYNRYSDRIEHIYIRSDRENKNKKVLAKIQKHPMAPIHLIKHSSDILKCQNKLDS